MFKRLVIASLILATVAVLATPRLSAAFNLRKYYLTTGKFDGSQPLTACAVGYHMANLFEINDPSNLQYNTTLGFTSEDSGSGPPTFDGGAGQGWIRNGGDQEHTVGSFANCDAHTTNSSLALGIVVNLSNSWGAPSISISPWQAVVKACNLTFRVWCVQNADDD